MSYFKKISDYQTYSGHDSEFHYDFNANSGGGQAFLGGKIVDMDGKIASPSELDGLSASFALRIRNQLISLSSGGNATYAISPRGAGSQSVKLGVQGKVNPNNLMASALMLPKTCGRNMAVSVTVSPLTIENYWLRSMWLDVDRRNTGVATFIPKDFIFEGGRSKRQGVTAQKDTVIGNQQFFKLDYVRRVEDIINLAERDGLPDYALAALRFYRDIYLGDIAFEYEKASDAVAKLMCDLSLDYCDTYSGYSDPLAFLMELNDRTASTHHISREEAQTINQPHNMIYFGAPGTGKSYQLNKLAVGDDSTPGLFPKDHVTRVTFHPDYTYAQFVGCFKPYSDPKKDDEVTYKYVAGPFLETYLAAITHPRENYVLIIEELNRANPAAVFGDIFQLLDRKDDGMSEYTVAVPREMADCIGDYFDHELSQLERDDLESFYDDLGYDAVRELSMQHLKMPPNMYIWATMNSADQGVFPMDTAFKRRWDFHYMGINDGSSVIESCAVPVGTPTRMVSWDALRRGINRVLLDAKVNEDKLLGPFFISPSRLRDANNFTQVFEDKVLLYLFEDAAKTKKMNVFAHEGNATYSDICEDFETMGELAFKGMKELPVIEPAQDDVKQDVEDSGE